MTLSFPRSIKWSSWTTWWGPHCPYMGWLHNGSREPGSCSWTKLRLQCNCMRTKWYSWVGMDSHRLSCDNLMTRKMCRNGMPRRRNGYRDGQGGGVGSVHLLYCGIANVWLCTLPLTRGGVGIRLSRSRWLAPSVDAVRCSWSASTRTRLISIPQLAKLFTNFRFQLLKFNAC